MRNHRFSGRKTARRTSVLAAGGVVAMLALTGCLGDKDEDASSTPSASSSAKSSTSARPTGSSTANPSGLPTQVEAIDLKKGDCITSTSSGDISKKPCTGPHTAEVVANYDLADGDSPMDLDFDEKVSEKCSSFVDPVIARQPNADELSVYMYMPTVSSYIQGEREVTCLVVRKDDAPLTAPLV
jgi:hypothetical protein